MRLIKPKFEIIEQETSKGLKGVFKMIEIAGRTCYKSEENITEDSAESFVNRMIKSGHGATLEHGTVYLHLPPGSPITGYKYRDNPYSKFTRVRRTEENTPVLDTYITTNYRVIIENGWEDDLQYLCEPSIWHYKRYTVRFTCDRGVSHEFVRHKIILCVA